MTAPLFFLPPGSLAGAARGDLVCLDGAEGRHAATVMRLRSGEEVQVSDQAGHLAQGAVETVGAGELTVVIEGVTRVERPALHFTLAQALAKGGRDELAVETATELGVDTVVPWQAPRSVVKWVGERGEKSRRKWASVTLAAAKQSRRPLLPVVEDLHDTAALARRVARTECAVVLHEAADARLADVELPAAGEVLLVVGPEGGIGDAELEVLRAAGARVVRLGDTVLRASTAGAAALAALSARCRW